MQNPKDFKKVFVIDTNIVLDNANNIFQLSQNGENLIVIPETVLDEIDSKKSSDGEIGYHARQFARMLSDINPTKEIDGDITTVKAMVENSPIYFVSKEVYEVDYDVEDNIRNDRKILEVAKDYIKIKELNNACFISLDVMARVRAISMGIKTELFNNGIKEEKKLEFIKHITLDEHPENHSDILEYDPEYNINYFSYIIDNGSFKKSCVIQNGKIIYIDDFELAKQDIKPSNTEQKLFAHAILDDYYKILVIEALSGSGKTAVAISTAMRMVKDKNSPYKKIVYIRNSIESTQKGEEIGFLKGGLEEKLSIYNSPLFDTLNYIAMTKLNQSKHNKSDKTPITKEMLEDEVEELKSKYNIETRWPGSLRGGTISGDSIVIIDESQNFSSTTMQTTLTRIDKSCKVIVLGSFKQIDNPYLNKYNNGLSILLNSTKDEHEEVKLFAIELKKVLRGPITEFAERIFSKE